jgi:NADPH:quinone reductase-like Zn-dependent oxidoreductase
VVVLGPDAAAKPVGESEVAIKILAAPVSPVDLGIIQGKFPTPPLPAVAGTEGVGVVTAVGSKVSGISVNDWVVPAIPAFGK